MNNIDISNVTKKFGKVTALNDVTLNFCENKIYGLLGRNGAGKTTLLNIITNKIFADKGEVLINGNTAVENDKAQSSIYCMTADMLYPNGMKVKEVIRWTKVFYDGFDSEYADELTKKFMLDTNKRVKSLSTGYSTILKMILALSCNAEFLLLDEPILGLDANHRHLFYKELIKSYQKNPKTIVISTHLIEEVSDVIEEVIVIDKGEILINDIVENVLKLGYAVSGKASYIDEYIMGKDTLSVETIGGLKTAYLFGKKDSNDELEFSRLDLQKLFIHLTNSREELQ